MLVSSGPACAAHTPCQGCLGWPALFRCLKGHHKCLHPGITSLSQTLIAHHRRSDIVTQFSSPYPAFRHLPSTLTLSTQLSGTVSASSNPRFRSNLKSSLSRRSHPPSPPPITQIHPSLNSDLPTPQTTLSVAPPLPGSTHSRLRLEKPPTSWYRPAHRAGFARAVLSAGAPCRAGRRSRGGAGVSRGAPPFSPGCRYGSDGSRWRDGPER